MQMTKTADRVGQRFQVGDRVQEANAFGKGKDSNIDTVRNQIIEVVEETLDNDITRNGNAIDTQIIEASTDEGTIYPYGGVRITARVLYEFTRGSA